MFRIAQLTHVVDVNHFSWHYQPSGCDKFVHARPLGGTDGPITVIGRPGEGGAIVIATHPRRSHDATVTACRLFYRHSITWGVGSRVGGNSDSFGLLRTGRYEVSKTVGRVCSAPGGYSGSAIATPHWSVSGSEATLYFSCLMKSARHVVLVATCILRH
jgi:hypothetical protein